MSDLVNIIMSNKLELEQSQADFQRLVQEGVLPPKMEIKLHYLQAAILGSQLEPKKIESLPEF